MSLGRNAELMFLQHCTQTSALSGMMGRNRSSG